MLRHCFSRNPARDSGTMPARRSGSGKPGRGGGSAAPRIAPAYTATPWTAVLSRTPRDHCSSSSTGASSCVASSASGVSYSDSCSMVSTAHSDGHRAYRVSLLSDRFLPLERGLRTVTLREIHGERDEAGYDRPADTRTTRREHVQIGEARTRCRPQITHLRAKSVVNSSTAASLPSTSKLSTACGSGASVD